jgi:hypothetical protein
MHSEHLNNVRPGWVAIGWLLSIGATSLILIALVAMGMLDPDSTSGGRWIAIAVTLGFLIGGAMVGFTVALAPMLHGVLIGLTSLIAWALVNGVVSLFFPTFTWTALDGPLTVNIILVQVVGAVLGARIGYRFTVPRPLP